MACKGSWVRVPSAPPRRFRHHICSDAIGFRTRGPAGYRAGRHLESRPGWRMWQEASSEQRERRAPIRATVVAPDALRPRRHAAALRLAGPAPQRGALPPARRSGSPTRATCGATGPSPATSPSTGCSTTSSPRSPDVLSISAFGWLGRLVFWPVLGYCSSGSAPGSGSGHGPPRSRSRSGCSATRPPSAASGSSAPSRRRPSRTSASSARCSRSRRGASRSRSRSSGSP